jgi:long-chain acyl-CoA synthetase
MTRTRRSHTREAIKKFAILEEDFTEAGGQLTPTMKVRRQVIMEQIAALYGEGTPS